MLHIQEHAKSLYGHQHIYESQLIEISPRNFKGEALKREDWLYAVCRWQEDPTTAQREILTSALLLQEMPIRVGATLKGGLVPQITTDPVRDAVTVWKHTMSGNRVPLVMFGSPELNDLSDCVLRLSTLASEQSVSFNLFNDLLRIDENSDMWILGLFAVIESVLTSRPEPTDPTSSIGRQIRNKMPLIENRLTPLNYSEFGESISPHKVWKLLYGIRSSIAHGSLPSYSAPVESRDRVSQFMVSAVQLTLRALLFETQLVSDLKKC